MVLFGDQSEGGTTADIEPKLPAGIRNSCGKALLIDSPDVLEVGILKIPQGELHSVDCKGG
jgi:hypothetical protein